MNYILNTEQSMLVDLAKQITLDYVKNYKHYDEEEKFPEEVINNFCQNGFLGLIIPLEYNGLGRDVYDLNLVCEEISKHDASISTTLVANYLGILPIINFASEEQKRKYLPLIAAGSKKVAFAVTEAEAGSDVASISTTGVLENDKYIINGKKQFITNGDIADIFVVAVKTNPEKATRGISLFIIEKGTQGFEIGKKEKKLGIRASCTNELIFNHCEVSKENVLGLKPNFGFGQILRTFEESRLTVAAQAVGIAQGALDQAIQYGKNRIQFNQKILSFQGIQWMVADMATKIEAARALLYTISTKYKEEGSSLKCLSAQAKVFASDTATEVTSNALQILGGYGFMRDYSMEKYFRDAKITQIYEGTNQILNNIIALEVIKRSQ